MREIKFRAWVPRPRRMLYKLTRLFFGDNGEPIQFLTETPEPLGARQELQPFILMQYTGLHDKNGKEIYEGDIIQLPYIDPMGRITSTPGKKRAVIFFNGTFCFKRKGHYQPLLDLCEQVNGKYIPNYGNATVYKDFIGEVIGNIYENGDLLNG